VRQALSASGRVIDWAERVLAAALDQHGVFSFEGRMVDERYCVTLVRSSGARRLVLATSVFSPDECPLLPQLLMCGPGGSYTREYWHPSNLDPEFQLRQRHGRPGVSCWSRRTWSAPVQVAAQWTATTSFSSTAAKASTEVVVQVKPGHANCSLVPGVGPVAHTRSSSASAIRSATPFQLSAGHVR